MRTQQRCSMAPILQEKLIKVQLNLREKTLLTTSLRSLHEVSSDSQLSLTHKPQSSRAPGPDTSSYVLGRPPRYLAGNCLPEGPPITGQLCCGLGLGTAPKGTPLILRVASGPSHRSPGQLLRRHHFTPHSPSRALMVPAHCRVRKGEALLPALSDLPLSRWTETTLSHGK